MYYPANASQSLVEDIVYDRFGTLHFVSYAICSDPTCGIPPPPETAEDLVDAPLDLETQI